MTHKTKDCVERPRKRGASKTGKNIAATNFVRDQIALGFDGKRDRYNGFDAADYGRVVDRYEKAEALKAEVAKRRELERAYRKANRDGAGNVPAVAATPRTTRHPVRTPTTTPRRRTRTPRDSWR